MPRRAIHGEANSCGHAIHAVRQFISHLRCDKSKFMRWDKKKGALGTRPLDCILALLGADHQTDAAVHGCFMVVVTYGKGLVGDLFHPLADERAGVTFNETSTPLLISESALA